MRYLNGCEVLPEELIRLIQGYVQGMYIYIPKEGAKKGWGANTNYRNELAKRDSHIYRRYLEGIPASQLGSRYHLSASSIRRIILKKKKEYAGMDKKIKNILSNWSKQGEVKQIYSNVWSITEGISEISEGYVIKVYNQRNTLERNISVQKALHQAGIPVAEVVPVNNGNDYYEEGDNYYVMTRRLPGNNLGSLGQQPKEIFYRMGTVIGRLHLAFQECEDKLTLWNNSLLEEMTGWVQERLSDSEWDLVSEKEYRLAVEKLQAVYDELPRQLIHRDVHFGNFLFENAVFSGYIDFDLSQKNIRIFDIAYFLLGIISEDDNNYIDRERWFDLVYEVIRGYEEHVRLTGREKEALAVVMQCIELLFTAYFVSINDEKCAGDAAGLFRFAVINEKRISDRLRDN
jgi:Ser/Thr protein kinase RdoA (MazF antagonist)